MLPIFDEAMGNLSRVYNSVVVATYPFSTFKKVVDVGGGNGSFMLALLQANPHMKGVLVDMPHVSEKARQRIAEAGFAQRCEVVAGDALTAVPEGADAYVLCRVIHDWADDPAAAILRTCRRAMSNNARLLVIERMLADRAQHDPAARSVSISDLQMMVMNGGRERSEAEYRALFARAGFTLKRIVPTESTMNVIEGILA